MTPFLCLTHIAPYFNPMEKVQAEQLFLRLLDQYQQAIYWHIRRMVVRHEDAEDVLQETFVRAFRSIESLREESAAKAWLYRIATNESLRHLAQNREALLSTEEVEAEVLDKLMETEYVDYDDAMAVVFQKAILSLPATQRTVFLLRYYDELSYEEIAQITESRVETLKVNYHYAQQRIKAYIKQYG